MTKAPDTLRIAIAQLNPIMGDIKGNLALAREARADAARSKADLVFFTELFISGYPPEDLVRKPAFLKDCMEAVEELAKDTADGGPGVIIGSPYAEDRADGHKVYNAAAVLDDGKVQTWRFKVDLPNYGEFDEKRVFDAGPDARPGEFSRRSPWHSRFARISGAIWAFAKRWPKAARKSCCRPMARPIIAARWISAIRSSSDR